MAYVAVKANDGQCLNLVSFSAINLECSGTDWVSWGQDYKEKHNLDSKQIWNSLC